MDRNINWDNNNAHQFFSDVPEPRFRTSQVWMAEMDETEGPGVEIIELHSREGSQSPQEEGSHMWSYAKSNGIQDMENCYAANQQARLKRRLRNKNLFAANESFDSDCDDSYYLSTHTHPPDDIMMFNPNIDFFDVLDTNSPRSLDGSCENIGNDNEPPICENAYLENECNGSGEYEELVSFNSPSGGTKRTIWIYSFKNRRLLRENAFDLENIPSRSTTCSTAGSPEEIIPEKTKAHVGRVATPIPKTYIPRLDLSTAATLPNVTEVTEPKSSPTLREPLKQQLFSKKPANGWLLDRTEQLTEVTKQNRSSNVVNWMALSPRERRRRSRHTNADIERVTPLEPVVEVTSSTEEKIKREPFPEIPEDVILKASPVVTRRSVKEPPSARKSVVESLVGDRGDCKFLQIPHINLDRKPLASTGITEPIEKLESNFWITEEPKLRQESLRTPYGPGNKDNDRVEVSTPCAGDRLMARNMALLKPSEWRAYSPIAASHLSLQLSLDSEPEGSSLLQRCISCFKCCKYRVH